MDLAFTVAMSAGTRGMTAVSGLRDPFIKTTAKLRDHRDVPGTFPLKACIFL